MTDKQPQAEMTLLPCPFCGGAAERDATYLPAGVFEMGQDCEEVREYLFLGKVLPFKPGDIFI